MDMASVYYLGVTVLMVVVFAAIVARTCSRSRREKGEAPKHRMMEED